VNKENDNHIDQMLYNSKSLGLLNIRELRDMGRKFGVPSPTTLKKDKLIEYILKIVYGEVATPSRSNYGRPSTRDFDMPKYIEKIKKNSDMTSELIKATLDNDFGSMTVSSPSSDYDAEDDIETRVFFEENGKFYLRVHQFVSSNNDIEISVSIVKRYNLENLDIIEIIKADEFYKIVTINGISIGGKFGSLTISGRSVVKGDNQVFNLRTKEEIENSINEIVETVEGSNLKLLIFSNKKYLDNENLNATYSLDEENSKIYKKFMNLVKTCEKFCSESEDVVLVIENADDIQKMINSFESSVSERIKKHLKEMFSKFLNLENIVISYKIEEDFNY